MRCGAGTGELRVGVGVGFGVGSVQAVTTSRVSPEPAPISSVRRVKSIP
jgi:hypothetical protein